MWQSRRKTLATIVSGVMPLRGTGAPAPGRAMDGPAQAKHRIKRVEVVPQAKPYSGSWVHGRGSSLFLSTGRTGMTSSSWYWIFRGLGQWSRRRTRGWGLLALLHSYAGFFTGFEVVLFGQVAEPEEVHAR